MEIKILHGDCIEVMRGMSDNSVDSIVTDPPAGISFMGKNWDKDKGGRQEWISWMQEVASECLRVIKPGGHALVWAIPRTSHWTGMAWEDAGWLPRDKIYHCFGSGFPKSLSISKEIDRIAGAEREVIGKGVYSNRGMTAHIKTNSLGAYCSSEDDVITVPATPEAKQWDGWGTALKPAIEEWWLFRKPFNGTVVANVLQWGTGGINVDGCRVRFNPDDRIAYEKKRRSFSSEEGKITNGCFNASPMISPEEKIKNSQLGRFPANFIHDGSDEVISLFPAKAGAFAPVKRGQNGNSRGVYGDFAEKGDDGDSFYNDSGSAARFFYCAKSSAKDREEGCEHLVARQRDHSRKEGNPGGDNPRNRGVKMKQNNHPTVKSTELMRYLCRLITPPGGIVLDPFMGSGSTGKGAVLEGFSFIGIEKDEGDEGYLDIARARIEFAKSAYDNQHKQKSLEIFGAM